MSRPESSPVAVSRDSGDALNPFMVIVADAAMRLREHAMVDGQVRCNCKAVADCLEQLANVEWSTLTRLREEHAALLAELDEMSESTMYGIDHRDAFYDILSRVRKLRDLAKCNQRSA